MEICNGYIMPAMENWFHFREMEMRVSKSRNENVKNAMWMERGASHEEEHKLRLHNNILLCWYNV